MTPKRIQMTRQRPWRAENPDAVIVSRPGKWGNPFKVGGFYIPRDSHWDRPLPQESGILRVIDRQHAVDLFKAHIEVENISWDVDLIRTELGGRDLACWCPLDDGHGNRVPCHADVLLELANEMEVT